MFNDDPAKWQMFNKENEFDHQQHLMYQTVFMSFLILPFDAYCLCLKLHPSTLYELSLLWSMFDKLDIMFQNTNKFSPQFMSWKKGKQLPSRLLSFHCRVEKSYAGGRDGARCE